MGRMKDIATDEQENERLFELYYPYTLLKVTDEEEEAWKKLEQELNKDVTNSE